MGGTWNKTEYEANTFAARLLMPARLIAEEGKKILAETSNSTLGTFIGKMSERFQVSEQAMKFRLINMGVIKKEDADKLDEVVT